MSDLFRQGIDQFIDFELGLYEVQSEGKEKELTKELALSMYVVLATYVSNLLIIFYFNTDNFFKLFKTSQG